MNNLEETLLLKWIYLIRSKFAEKVDLADSKSNVDKLLIIDKWKNKPTNLSNLKSKVDKLDIDKLAPVPVDLK